MPSVFAVVAVVEVEDEDEAEAGAEAGTVAEAQADAVVRLESEKEPALDFEDLNVVDPEAPSFVLRPASVASSPSFLRFPLVDVSAPQSSDGTVGFPHLRQGSVELC